MPGCGIFGEIGCFVGSRLNVERGWADGSAGRVGKHSYSEVLNGYDG